MEKWDILGELPQPLSEEEIQAEFQKWQLGDFQARDTIIVHNIKLVIERYRKKFSTTPLDYQDVISIGLIGLIKAVDSYEPRKNVKFSTYAFKCIDNEIYRVLKKNKNDFHNISYETYIVNQDQDFDLTLNKILGDQNVDLENQYIEKETLQIIYQLIEELPPLEKWVLKQYYGLNDDEPHLQLEIAQNIQATHQYVSLILIKALYHLKAKLIKMDILNIPDAEKAHYTSRTKRIRKKYE